MKYDFKKLKAARIAQRLTRTELASRAGVSIAAVSQIESGRGPWIKAIRELERVLGVNVIENKRSA
jgi:transcriptional regulator with XRE-family HTH domain